MALHRPAGQTRQVSLLRAPSAALQKPAGHTWHVLGDHAPRASDHVPAPQGLQAAREAAPDTLLQVPAGQLLHGGGCGSRWDCPAASRYCPILQGVQSSALVMPFLVPQSGEPVQAGP